MTSVRWSRMFPVDKYTAIRQYYYLQKALFVAIIGGMLPLNTPLRPDLWTDLEVDGLARLYNSEITAILDRLIPVRTVTHRRCASDPWFDDECRAVERQVRRLESAARETDPSDATAAFCWDGWTSYTCIGNPALQEARRSGLQKSTPKSSSMWHSSDQLIDTLFGRTHGVCLHPLS